MSGPKKTNNVCARRNRMSTILKFPTPQRRAHEADVAADLPPPSQWPFVTLELVCDCLRPPEDFALRPERMLSWLRCLHKQACHVIPHPLRAGSHMLAATVSAAAEPGERI